jgi:acetylcholinesterase
MMLAQSVGSALLLCGSAHALVASIPNTSSIGTVQVLNYNNLGPENNGTAALLVYYFLSNSNALACCETMSETLLPASGIQGGSGSSVTEMQLQLDYLVASNNLQDTDLLWVDGGNECEAYSYSSKSVSTVSCNQTLPALCSSKALPTTDDNNNNNNNTAAPADDLKVTISANGYNVTGFRDKRSFRFLGIPFADALSMSLGSCPRASTQAARPSMRPRQALLASSLLTPLATLPTCLRIAFSLISSPRFSPQN